MYFCLSTGYRAGQLHIIRYCNYLYTFSTEVYLVEMYCILYVVLLLWSGLQNAQSDSHYSMEGFQIVLL